MVVAEDSKRLVEKKDLLNLSILLSLALGIGVYLIATTVLIAKDGVFYIERAQEFASNPLRIIKGHPFGYPFLIFLAHKLVAFFGNNSSAFAWIYSAQSVSLISRVLSFIPLYFIGKMLVGSRRGFWGLVILVCLPKPAEFGSDALRDWPHLLFLAAGFMFLLRGADRGIWWMFGLTGLLAGLGYMIREVSAQLVAYGAIWLACQLFKPTKLRSRSRTIATAILLFSGFLIAAGPYMITRGAVLPPRVKYLIDSICSHRPAQPRGEQNPAARDRHENEYLAGYSQSTVHALYNIYKRIGESLIWVFAVPWLIGIFHHFRHCRETKGKFLMSLFICANIIFLVIRGSHFNKAVSTRYVLPLVAFTICYVPTGLEILSHFLSRIGRGSTSSPPQGQRWFYTLLIAGLCICLPKLVRPIGCDKQGYRDAADWLTKYATETDIVIVPDRRISFYAQRKGYLNANRVLKRAAYALIITENENEPLNLARAAQKVYSVTVDKRKKKGRKIVVYKML